MRIPTPRARGICSLRGLVQARPVSPLPVPIIPDCQFWEIAAERECQAREPRVAQQIKTSQPRWEPEYMSLREMSSSNYRIIHSLLQMMFAMIPKTTVMLVMRPLGCLCSRCSRLAILTSSYSTQYG